MGSIRKKEKFVFLTLGSRTELNKRIDIEFCFVDRLQIVMICGHASDLHIIVVLIHASLVCAENHYGIEPSIV